MSKESFRLPQNTSYEETIKFLTWEQFPSVMDKSIEYYQFLPQVGTYQHFNKNIVSFKEALLNSTERKFTLSGVGALLDYEKFGHTLKRPTPQLCGTGCEGNTLCLEPTCFGFTEGVIENNNVLRNICWSLALPCLKDIYYSDAQFERKLKRYFQMFFQQAPAVMQAFQRTDLLKNAIKVVATDTNIRITGEIGGQKGISLPFYIDPQDATAFPCLDSLPAGVGIGGINLEAFTNHVAPRLFHDTFRGREMVKSYGLMQDKAVAKEQTASVQDHHVHMQMLEAFKSMTALQSAEGILSDFTEDGLFPTFTCDEENCIIPVDAQVLENSTIYGKVPTSNPEHGLQLIRGLLLVPSNWKYNLVEPPKDNFSDLGLGQGLNFGMNTPGVFSLKSSMFTNMTKDGTVVIGQKVGRNGMIVPSVSGLKRRSQPIKEAVRTELIQTYAAKTCGAPTEGQLNPVGNKPTAQNAADGFMLRSTMYLGTDVKGTARPVLLLFKTDTPRSARAIEVCDEVVVEATGEAGNALVDCCPGNANYAILTFKNDATSDYAVGDLVAYRSGRKADTVLAAVTAVTDKTVSIEAVDASGAPDPAGIIPCCEGGQNDDYGVLGELIVNAGATLTATASEIMKATYDAATSSWFLELNDPLAATTAATAFTLTLENGDVVELETVTDAEGVFVQVAAAATETGSLADIDCECLRRAVLAVA